MLAVANRTVGRRRDISVRDVMALALFGDIAEKLAKSLRVRESLHRAGMLIHPRLYIARILFNSSMVLFASLVALLVEFLLGLPLLILVVTGLFAVIVPLMIFVWGLYYPSAKAQERATRTEMEFPFFAAYMTAMAYGGVTPERLIERLAEMKVFKALREEALRIVREVRLFGVNILAALERNAIWHPSRIYRDFILGYLTTLRTGGDVIHYLEIRTTEVFQSRMEDLRNRAERVGLIVEAYAAVAVLGTMSFYIFFIISGLVATGGGLGGMAGLALYNFIVLPLVAMAIVMILDSLLPGMENLREPYAYLLITAPLGALVALTLLSMTGALAYQGGFDIPRVVKVTVSVASAFIVLSLGPALSYITRARRERAITYRLAAFFRDLSEVRRTGLSPEKSIIMLSERDYGPLTPIIQRIAGALAIGLHVERAVRRAIRGYRNWMLRVTMRFLVDAMEVGGGSPHTIDSLARFLSTLVEISDQMRKRLRPYIVMPYFGSIMVAATAILTLSMLVNAISAAGGVTGGQATVQATMGGLQVNITPENVHNMLLMASVAAIVNAWLSGLVAGKIQDQTLASGFLHATILTLLTTVVVIVLLNVGGSLMGAGPQQAA